MSAKKITRKNNAIRFNHVCFEENITVKTKNPCIGQADYEREECKKCVNARGNVALVCFCMSGLDKKVKVTEKGGKRKSGGKVPWNILMNEYKESGKASCLAMALELGLTENSAKDTVNHVRIVSDAWNGKGNKSGKYYQYCQWIKKGKKGEQPKISNTAKSYCNKLVKFC